MALDIVDQTRERRPIGFLLLGFLLLAGAGFLFYDVKRQATMPVAVTPSTYTYKINQSVDTSIQYFQSSFYTDNPGAGNSAYVAELTKTVDATLHYKYRASREAQLSTMYSAIATVHAKYSMGVDGKNIANVWSREYPLVKPVTSMKSGKDFSFEPSISIPFADYRKIVDQFKTSLAVPITAEASIVFTVRVYGTVDGTPMDDIRVSTVTMPLDQPIYTLANKFEKEDVKQVVTKKAKTNQDALKNYERIAVGVLGVLGLAAIAYGMRRQIFKSPYQRELDRIYRLHDGIIIRASKPADMTGKNVVTVKSFDDMLNLEEELKVPIVSSPAGNDGTRFIIIRDDIVYVYPLGNVLLDDESIEEADKIALQKRPLGTAAKTYKRRIQ
jgi:hypothetical protein